LSGQLGLKDQLRHLDKRKLSLTACFHSVLVFFRQGLGITYGPCAVTCLPFQSFDLPKKLCCEGHFAPEALIARVASQARVHVTHSRVEGAPETAQLLLAQVKQHVRRASFPG
jgi:hypothetical protein